MFLPDAPSIEVVLVDPSVRFWLKDALRSALSRDPIDAASDAMLLANVLDARAATAFPEPSPMDGAANSHSRVAGAQSPGLPRECSRHD